MIFYFRSFQTIFKNVQNSHRYSGIFMLLKASLYQIWVRLDGLEISRSEPDPTLDYHEIFPRGMIDSSC